MEETLQQETQELEDKNQNEDQGGIRRRLRDRDLLRKRKAEAEEKETNQVESQRKRPRADSGLKRRGRPKKSEPTVEISVIQEEEVPQEAPAVVVVPEGAEVISDQMPGSLAPTLAAESQPSSILAAPASQPVLGSIQSPIFAPTLTPPAPVYPTPALFSPSAPVPSPAKVLDTAPIPVQDLAPAPAPAPEAIPFPDPDPVLTPAPVPAAAPLAAPPQVETLFTESQGGEAPDQVLIEDLGPDEEDDIFPSQDKGDDEDLIETPLINVPEQNEMFSIPTFSSMPPPQKYFPGNSF